MKKAKIVALATDNPHAFDVKVKTASSLAQYRVKAKDSKSAILRYTDPAFSTCVLSLNYSFA